jgi:hypothetical protein
MEINNVIQYSVAFIFIFVLLWFMIIKILYPFWNLQPVLHPYDIYRHIYFLLGGEPFIIWKKSNLKSNKYIDLLNIRTFKYDNINEKNKNDLLILLRRKYINSPNILFNINEIWLNNLVNVGYNQPSFVSLLNELNSNGKGCCVSYPIMIMIPHKPILNGYFMDLFTVENIKPQKLFQTHEYNQNLENPIHGGNITFFKKEITGYLGITPFIETNLYLYSLLQSRFHSIKQKVLPISIELLIIDKKGTNSQYLIDFFNNYNKHIITVGFATILNWIKNNYWYVFILVQKEEILAIYFFRDTQLIYEEYSLIDSNSKSIELVNSFNNINNNDLFYLGFFEAVRQLSTKINLDYRLIQIPDISAGNSIILQNWDIKNTPIQKTFLGYYFFNYCWKCNKKNVLIIL